MNTISVLNNHTFFIAQIEAIGAEAVHRAVKALSVAKGYLMAEDISITCAPEYSNVLI